MASLYLASGVQPGAPDVSGIFAQAAERKARNFGTDPSWYGR